MANDSESKPDEKSTSESRRRFIRRVGGTVFGISLVDICDGTQQAQAAACGSGGTPPFGAADAFCSAFVKDDNCGITQLPNPEKDHDQQCAAPLYTGTDPDQSCGDCDDIHDSDQHCSKPLPNGSADPDELCGHQHNATSNEDDNCSATVSDAGCGTHKTKYNVPGTSNDTDEHCVGQNTDMNCSNSTEDATCNTKTFPSTTSPDENCRAGTEGTQDKDEACSHYDQDESCNVLHTDEACGEYNKIFNDTDDHCSPAIGQSDDTDDPNDGPIKPWCPKTDDPDYYDPPPPPPPPPGG